MKTTKNSVITLVAGKNYVTRGGQKAHAVCMTNGKMFVHVYSLCGSASDFDAKYTVNGYRWSESSPCYYDLIEEAA